MAAAGPGHVVLLGDSILDNKAYVGGGPDVIAQLRSALPGGWRATLAARDGAVVADVARQVGSIPPDTTHLVVSAGGNDALGSAYLLDAPARTVTEALLVLGEATEAFARSYRDMVETVAKADIPTALCTIYDTPTDAPGQPVIRTALSLFNDAISREAFARRLSLVDLRLICDEDEDYANPIEPSVAGGAKIAAALSRWAAGGATSDVIV